MARSDKLDPEIYEKIEQEYKESAFWLPFDALEIKETFNKEELKELRNFRKELKEASSSNVKKVNAVVNYSKIVLKLLKLGKIVV